MTTRTAIVNPRVTAAQYIPAGNMIAHTAIVTGARSGVEFAGGTSKTVGYIADARASETITNMIEVHKQASGMRFGTAEVSASEFPMRTPGGAKRLKLVTPAPV